MFARITSDGKGDKILMALASLKEKNLKAEEIVTEFC